MRTTRAHLFYPGTGDVDMIGVWGEGYACAACAKGRCIMSGMRSREMAYVEAQTRDLAARIVQLSQRLERYCRATDAYLVELEKQLRQARSDIAAHKQPAD